MSFWVKRYILNKKIMFWFFIIFSYTFSFHPYIFVLLKFKIYFQLLACFFISFLDVLIFQCKGQAGLKYLLLLFFCYLLNCITKWRSVTSEFLMVSILCCILLCREGNFGGQRMHLQEKVWCGLCKKHYKFYLILHFQWSCLLCAGYSDSA